jgi:hypothetical protein
MEHAICLYWSLLYIFSRELVTTSQIVLCICLLFSTLPEDFATAETRKIATIGFYTPKFGLKLRLLVTTDWWRVEYFKQHIQSVF